MAEIDHRHKNPRLPRGYFKPTFEAKTKRGDPIACYCEYCYWWSSNPQYKYCAYGHGLMKDINQYFNDESLLEGI